jgi:shikimate kinase
VNVYLSGLIGSGKTTLGERLAARLGGGTVRYAWNRDALRGTGVLVFLEAGLATLAARVRAADRPRVNPGVSLEEDLAAIWVAAEPLYRAADLTYRTDAGRSVEEEVEDLARLLRERRP